MSPRWEGKTPVSSRDSTPAGISVGQRIAARYRPHASPVVRIVAAYFAFSAVVVLGLLVVRGIQILGGGDPRILTSGRPIPLGVLMAGFGVAWLQAARLLWDRRRSGAYWGIGALIVEATQWLGGVPPTNYLLNEIITVIALALAWRHLNN
ncbi:MAG: hypothetical protein H7Z74_14035 [Anaerolineae bacterium]|nr:hypothetical protein [Gemmatimonadaceae bacterium]